MTDLKEAHEKGHVSQLPHYNTMLSRFEDKNVTPILRELITKSSLPLKAIETDFAVDSSGFSTSRFHRWFDEKHGELRQHSDWIKVHLMVGVRTNVVTAIEIKDRHAADTKELPHLLHRTAEHFNVREISADKAYSSHANFDFARQYGATPYIAFRSNTTGRGPQLWEKMFLQFQLERETFLSRYHKRSNVESTFSMIKAKFRDHIRSKTPVAMVNETLCKILAHNLCVVIQEAQELGVAIDFRA